MAIKKCKECKHMVSTDAKFCPNCGKRKSTLGLILNFICAILILFFGIYLFSTTVKNEFGLIMIPISIVWLLGTIISWKLKFR